MDTEQNKALARRAAEHFSQGSAETLDQFYGAEVRNHSARPGTPPGMEGMRQDYRALHTAFPDLRYTVDDILAEGDKVVVRGTLRGTHTGSLFGLAPTGRPVTVTDIGVFRIAGGKIVEWWHQQDDLGLMTQIGQMPPAGAGH